MDNLVRLRTTYSKKEIVSFARNINFRIKKGLIIAYAVVICLLVAFFVLDMCATGTPDFSLVALAFLLVVVLCTLWFAPCITAKKNRVLDADVVFTFTDDGVATTYENSRVNGTENIKYDVLYRVYETSDRLYLMINRGQGFIVDLTRIETGDLDTLHHLLNTHIDAKKYKRK